MLPVIERFPEQRRTIPHQHDALGSTSNATNHTGIRPPSEYSLLPLVRHCTISANNENTGTIRYTVSHTHADRNALSSSSPKWNRSRWWKVAQSVRHEKTNTPKKLIRDVCQLRARDARMSIGRLPQYEAPRNAAVTGGAIVHEK